MGKTKAKQIKKRAHIIESALRLMKDSSFEDIGILDICREAGISTGTFYHYFNKKSDILVGMLGLVDVYLEEEVVPILTGDDEIENLKTIVHRFARHIDENGIERSVNISKMDITDNDLAGNKRFVLVLVEKHIRLGQEKGQIITGYTVGELAELFLIVMRGVSTDWSRRLGSYSIVEKMDMFVGFFLDAIKAK